VGTKVEKIGVTKTKTEREEIKRGKEIRSERVEERGKKKKKFKKERMMEVKKVVEE